LAKTPPRFSWFLRDLCEKQKNFIGAEVLSLLQMISTCSPTWIPAYAGMTAQALAQSLPTRMRLFSLIAVIGATLFSLALLMRFVVQRVAARLAERAFPPPGRLIEVDGRRAHIDSAGSGSPTIVLESGLDVSVSAVREGSPVRREHGAVSSSPPVAPAQNA
jgi:hypothetical protein